MLFRQADPTLQQLLLIFVGFLSGSIQFSRILPQFIMHIDVTQNAADHNPGAFNVFKSCGPVMGSVCVFLDIAKGYVPVLVSMLLLDFECPLFPLIMAAPVLGHALGIFYHFHGGKAIAVSFGVLLALLPSSPIVFVLALIYILTSTLIRIPDHRIRSIVTFAAFALLASFWSICLEQTNIALGSCLISIICLYKHVTAPIAVSDAAAKAQGDVPGEAKKLTEHIKH